MPRVYDMAFLLGFFLLSLVESCSSSSREKMLWPYQAAIVTSVDGHYRLTTVTFQTLTDMSRVIGTIGEVLAQGSFDLTAESGDVIKSVDTGRVIKNRGHGVAIDYAVEHGVAYPRDFGSMEILGLYYAYEKTVAFWQDNFQISLLDPKPNLYYNPSVVYSNGETTASGILKMNAAYMPIVNDFLFFKTSRVEKFPVKINLAVVAHEYAHYIFHQKFALMDASLYNSVDIDNQDQLDGINEGLADFFSFLVTKNPMEYGESISAMSELRNMPVPWTLSTLSDAPCAGTYYCKGSVLSSALYEIATGSAYSPHDVGAVVLAALPGFREDWLKLRNGAMFDYDVLLNRILEKLNQTDRSQYCRVFIKWFDDDAVRTKLTCG